MRFFLIWMIVFWFRALKLVRFWSAVLRGLVTESFLLGHVAPQISPLEQLRSEHELLRRRASMVIRIWVWSFHAEWTVSRDSLFSGFRILPFDHIQWQPRSISGDLFIIGSYSVFILICDGCRRASRISLTVFDVVQYHLKMIRM